MAEPIEIKTDEITLGQFIKLANIVESGGMVKMFLQDYNVYVNGEQDQRRGRKLKIDDRVEVEEVGTFIVAKEN
ncbi:S4 domain-containing protein YaaA [Alkalibacillus haloalkaliphilus]|uniref:S4 domain-containing protein YaaA n=1 Tax=Alkalibacillus haloalkaliphilus TaxID=94136 RepID=UPI002935D74F|nr:S4 domain-containing protein YaaA [Alkalibacillus haloalkaliphilus]MDV2581612.1 S4 domain-containing protein YaaA [Alkalibacillus haloalkaliphilus]